MVVSENIPSMRFSTKAINWKSMELEIDKFKLIVEDDKPVQIYLNILIQLNLHNLSCHGSVSFEVRVKEALSYEIYDSKM